MGKSRNLGGIKLRDRVPVEFNKHRCPSEHRRYLVQFNQTYLINDGQESILFTEGKGNTGPFFRVGSGLHFCFHGLKI